MRILFYLWLAAVIIGFSLIFNGVMGLVRGEAMYSPRDRQLTVLNTLIGIALGLIILITALRFMDMVYGGD